MLDFIIKSYVIFDKNKNRTLTFQQRREVMKRIYLILFLSFVVTLSFISKPSISSAGSREWHKISFSVCQIDEYHSMNYFDALIGKEVIIPTLRKYQDKIKIFFFKQTLKRGYEHRFSFCFLAKKKYANRILNNILDHWIIRNLEQRNIIEVKFHVTEKKGIAGLSNPSWDKKTRERWPYQMQRTSKTWLSDICRISEGLDYNNSNLHVLLDHYRKIDRRLNKSQRRKPQQRKGANNDSHQNRHK